MSSKQSGFTLIELMIVVAIIAIIASIAIPNLLSARIQANESAAVATLRNISSAQEQCRSQCSIDVNGNGTGEYAFFGELSGDTAVRASTRVITPPILSTAFGNVNLSLVVRSGYVFQMFLPDVNTLGVIEDPTGGDPDNGQGVSPVQAETLWACYAWPQVAGSSGVRTFFVNHRGDVLTTQGNSVQYSQSTAVVPAFNAAMLGVGTVGMGAPVAANTIAFDTNRWTVLN